MLRPSLILCFSLASVVSARDAQAQGRVRPAVADSAASKIMARVGNQTGALWLRDILRQAGAQYPQAKLDEIADSLVSRAVDPAGVQRQGEAYMRAVNAVNALVLAGASAPLSGSPYAGALDRAITIHKRAPSQTVRARALAGMLASPAHSRAVAYLRQVAESTDATAYDAVELLITDANGGSWVGTSPATSERQESAAALKSLASVGRISDEKAAKLLERWLQK